MREAASSCSLAFRRFGIRRIAAFALGETATPPDAVLRRTADWLLSKEVRREGDWSVKRPDAEPSGWAFEFNNEFYPDIDDTAMVLLALPRRALLTNSNTTGLRKARA